MTPLILGEFFDWITFLGKTKCDRNKINLEQIPDLVKRINGRKFQLPIFGFCKITSTVFWTLYGLTVVGNLILILTEVNEICRDGLSYFNHFFDPTRFNNLDCFIIFLTTLSLITVWQHKGLFHWHTFKPQYAERTGNTFNGNFSGWKIIYQWFRIYFVWYPRCMAIESTS